MFRRSKHTPHFPLAHGFTLVELLVVIAIIGILIALLLPAVQAARESARRSQCISQLKQIGLALQSYHDVNGYFPSGRTATDNSGVAWSYSILPYVEEQAIYDAYDPDFPADAIENEGAMQTPIALYACPSRRSAAADRDFDNDDTVADADKQGVSVLGDYAANAGLEENIGMEDNDFVGFGELDLSLAGPMFSGSRIKAGQVIDGLSKTLAVGEKHLPPIETDWDPQLYDYEQGDTCFLSADRLETVIRGTEDGLAESPQDDSNADFGGPHPGVCLFVFLDGHTEGLSVNSGAKAFGVNPNEVEDIDIEEGWEWFAALSTVAGEEVVQE